MSDIYIQHGKIADTSSIENFFAFTNKDWFTKEHKDDNFVLLRRNDLSTIYKPIINHNNISIYILGKICFNNNEWAKIQTEFPSKDGVLSNYILSLYLKKGITALTNYLNGAYGIIIKNENNEIFIITDRMGFYPIYYANNTNKTILSSHPDSIALDNAFSTLDMTSIGEYISYGKVEHPNTYYQHIKQLEPGAIYKLNIKNKLSLVHQYFKPEFKWQGESPKILVNELKNALLGSVQDRTLPILGKSGVFLSGGMDSRSILAGSTNPKEMISATFYDEINSEFLTAESIANRYQSKHIGLKRSFEYYIENAEKSTLLMAGQWNIQDAHYTGFINELLATNVDNWLSGCFADWMFKGLASNTKYLTLMGKVIPVVKRINDFDEVYFQPKFILKNNSIEKDIQNRKKLKYANIQQYSGEHYLWNIEKLRLFPINRESTMGTRHTLSRTLKRDAVLADNRLIEVFEKLPVSYKLKNNIWGKAVGKICISNNDIKDNNWGARINAASDLEKIYSFLITNIKRKISKYTSKETSKIITTGSWPNFEQLPKHSTTLPNIWDNISKESFDIIEQITYTDYKKVNYLTLTNNSLDYFYRLLTILLWLNQKGKTY